MNWRYRLAQLLCRYRGRSLVVAVSGGSDSVGLVRMLHEIRGELDLSLSIAHLNHGTRAEAAKADADFVAALAESLSLPFDLGEWKPTRAAHFESDARNARYEWLVEIARQQNAGLVAVGHTRDDQAETILHRILRGTGPRGLSGIPHRRILTEKVTLIRPLLDVSRQEIRDYLASIGQPFREDISNVDLSRTRNRIRHDLLPKLESEYNPAIRDALIRLGKLSVDWDSHRNLHVEAAKVTADENAIVLRIGPLQALPLSVRAEVIRRIWRGVGWPEREMDAKRWIRLASSLENGPARFSIGGGFVVLVGHDELIVGRSHSESDPEISPVSLTIPGEVTWGNLRIHARFDPSEGCEAIDFDRIEGPILTVRAPADGDRFEPLGLKGHSQPLNDFFRGRGVRRKDRQNVPIVCDEQGIIWVVGHRIAERVKRAEATLKLVYLGCCD